MGLNWVQSDNNSENSYLKPIIYLEKKLFYNISIKIKIFCDKINICLKYWLILWLTCFESNWIEKIFTEMKILQCIEKYAVFNFNDVKGILYCALNIEWAQSAVIFSFEFTL